jgi:DNA-binding HxlR family transcriptional regulator
MQPEFGSEARCGTVAAVATRTYGQYCGLAHALDALGERWTLLVLRELLAGPRRFSDLLSGLPGISTALLTTRLRSLEDEGVVHRRRLPPPAGSTVYELTEAGRELEPVVLGLARWGRERLGERTPEQTFDARWAMVALQASYDAKAAEGVHQTYDFTVGDETFHARVDDGRVELRDGPSGRPDATLVSDPDAFARLAYDPDSARDALADGSLRVEAIRTWSRPDADLARGRGRQQRPAPPGPRRRSSLPAGPHR